MENYIETTAELGKQFYLDFKGKGKLVMLNLLKFKKIADYSGVKDFESKKQISGKEAYQLYIANVAPELEKVGSKILFSGNSKNYLIGPDSESWDAVLLVEHQSLEFFLEFTKNEEYLKSLIHRIAALENSRLLPTLENKGLF